MGRMKDRLFDNICDVFYGKYEDCICQACNGSGESITGDTACSQCDGTGEDLGCGFDESFFEPEENQ